MEMEHENEWCLHFVSNTISDLVTWLGYKFFSFSLETLKPILGLPKTEDRPEVIMLGINKFLPREYNFREKRTHKRRINGCSEGEGKYRKQKS